MDLVTDASTSIRDNLLEMLTNDWITVPVEKLLDVIGQMEKLAVQPPLEMIESKTWENGYRSAIHDLIVKIWPDMK
jgi:hypothetical protein